MRLFLLASLTFLFLVFFVYQAEAAGKVLPQSKKTSKSSVVRRSTGSGITVSPRLHADKKALVVNFGNLQNASSVTYNLMYQTAGQEEGAGGTITSSGNTATRELLFGTCSKNVCRYHTNITDARFEVQTKLKSGKTSIKRYRIRV